jgi:hypothetical protein
VGVGVRTHRYPHYCRPRPRTGVSLHYSR